MASKLYVLQAGSWVHIPGDQARGLYNATGGMAWEGEQMYVLKITGGTAENPTKEWKLVTDMQPPSETVPGVGIQRGQTIDPPDAEVYWTVVTDTTDPRYNYSVRVTWYVNGAAYATDTVPQTDGKVTRTFTTGDDVYAVVRYVNDAGEGPTTTTSTLFL